MTSARLTPCSFYLSPKGCRNGEACRFAHLPAGQAPVPAAPAAGGTPAQKSRPPRQGRRKPATDTPLAGSSVDGSVEGGHVPAAAPAATPAVSIGQGDRSVAQPRSRVEPNPARAPVRKPVPKPLQHLQDMNQKEATAAIRDFEISQVERGFVSSFERLSPTTMQLKIVPSDPDFPYEISSLHIQLVVPELYPQQPCTLTVLNTDIPKGFSTNLERGFDVAAKKKASIISHLKWLDTNMEQLLQKPPASTIRFVSHASGQTPVHTPTESTRSKTQHSLSSLSSTASATPQVAEVPPVQPQPQPQPPRQQPPVPKARIYTATELDEARPKRQQQMAQLQARFRASIQTISSTELQLSLDSVNQATMPVKWQGPLWVNILIPVNYPLDPCEVRLKEDGHNPEIEMWRARNVEEGFRKIVTSNSQLSLFQLLNLLNRDLKDLMNLPQPPPPKPHASSITQLKVSDESGSSSDTTQTRVRSKPNDQSDTMGPKSNVIYVDPSLMVPPPQKVTFRESDVSSDAEEDSLEETDSDEDETDESEYDSSDLSESEDEEEDEASAQGGPNVTGSAPKRGIEVRMPEIKLEHISLLYCRSLSLVARCNRCKTLVDIPDLVPDENDAQSQPSSGHSKGSSSADHCKWKTCHICTSVVGAHFRTELIHLQSKTLGYLDLAGCTAFDILPSSFVPTCGECDQVLGAQPPPTSTPAVSAADLEPPSETDSHPVASTTTSATVPTGFRQKVGRGMTATANCRRCHVRMSLTLDGEMKFVKLSPGDLMKASSSDLKQLPLKKKNKAAPGQDIELKVGEPLPKKGTCSHYKRSRRWFRFPCCQRLYPCDTCHEEKEDHVGDTAKRMVCGYCSREQVVSDKPCVCGESPVKSAVGAGAKFWEGGEGMRDPSRLSNKDARKYRGLHKTEAKKQVGPENLRKRAAKKRL